MSDSIWRLDSASDFAEGWALVRLGERHFYIDVTGRVVLTPPPECNGLAPFCEGLALMRQEGL